MVFSPNNLLKNISGLIKKFFYEEKTDGILGIDFGSSQLKIVELKKEGNYVHLVKHGIISLALYEDKTAGMPTNLNEQNLKTALTEVISLNGMKEKNASFSIPASASLVFIIEIEENLRDEELKKYIPTEAQKYLPIPISQIVLDWWELPKYHNVHDSRNTGDNLNRGKNKREVLVAAVFKDTISKYKSVIQKTGLNLKYFELGVFSGLRSTISVGADTILLLDFGAMNTKIYIIKDGVLRSFDVVHRGSSDITRNIANFYSLSYEKAEELKKKFDFNSKSNNEELYNVISAVTNYIFTQTEGVVTKYENKYNDKVENIVIIGGGSLFNGFDSEIKSKFNANVSLGHPFSKLKTLDADKEILDSTDPMFAEAVGVALNRYI